MARGRRWRRSRSGGAHLLTPSHAFSQEMAALEEQRRASREEVKEAVEEDSSSAALDKRVRRMIDEVKEEMEQADVSIGTASIIILILSSSSS